MQVDFNQHPTVKFMIVTGKMYKAIMDRLLCHLKTEGLNETEFLVLYALAVQGSLTIQAIGERIHITSGTMTYTIDKLEQRGLVERIRCKSDRRKIYIDLTNEGQTYWDEVIGQHMTYLDKVFEDVSHEDLMKFMELAKKIGKSVAENEECNPTT